ncbi:MAG: NnrS family protein [Burkholderiaceae bacterium]
MLIHIDEVRPGAQAPPAFAVFETGFRVFFALAGIQAVVSIGLWALALFRIWQPPVSGMSIIQWHAHEMIFGWPGRDRRLPAHRGWQLDRSQAAARTCAGDAGRCLAGRAARLRAFGWTLASGLLDTVFIGWLTIAITIPIAPRPGSAVRPASPSSCCSTPAALIFTTVR